MCFYSPLKNRESKPGALNMRSVAGAVESIKEMSLIFRWNANSLIVYLKTDDAFMFQIRH